MRAFDTLTGTYAGWYNEPMRKTTSGFTIVELLIVVIVIAILATITIVSYSNISTSAMDSKIKSLVASVGKSLMLEEVNGVRPTAVGY